MTTSRSRGCGREDVSDERSVVATNHLEEMILLQKAVPCPSQPLILALCMLHPPVARRPTRPAMSSIVHPTVDHRMEGDGAVMRTTHSSTRKKRKKGDAFLQKSKKSTLFRRVGIGLAPSWHGGFFTLEIGCFLPPSL